MVSLLLPYFTSNFMNMVFLYPKFILGRCHRNMHVAELALLGTHQVMCLGLPSSDPFGCFRGLEDFTDYIKCHVPPEEPEGKHGSPFPGTDSDFLLSKCRAPASTRKGVTSQHPSLPLQQLQLVSPRGELVHTSRDTLSSSHILTQSLVPQVKILSQCS